MKAGRFEISGGLGDGLIKFILDDVHRLLGEVGLEIDHPEIVKELSDHEGVTVNDGRVCYSAELVEKARSQVATEDTNYYMQKEGETEFGIQPPFSPFNVIDARTGEVRPACDRDVVEGARLYDALGSRGPVHVHIADMDQKVAQVHIARLCCENSRAIGNWAPAYSYDQAMCIRDMFAAAGRPEPYVALQMTHSPMRLDAYFLDILWKGRETEAGNRGITGGGGAMPQAGVSAPVYWRTAAAQGLAEALGAWVTIKLIDPSVHPYASFLAELTDMSTAMGGSKAPESLSFALLGRHLMRELLGLTMAAHAGDLNEMLLWGLQGVRVFAGGGIGEEIFSLARTVIDREKIAYVESSLAGVEFPEEEGLAARIVSETLPQTSFLMHDSTLEFRQIHSEPRLFKEMMPAKLAPLLRDDSDELTAPANAIAAELIRTNEFCLDDDAAREVEAIYERGVKVLTS